MTPQEILSTESPLKGLPLPQLKDLWWEAKIVELPKGDQLFTEGDPSDGSLYMVVEGELAVLFVRKDGSTTSNPLTRGNLCGESALVNHQHSRTATVKVVSDGAVLLRWDGDGLLKQKAHAELKRILQAIEYEKKLETLSLRET